MIHTWLQSFFEQVDGLPEPFKTKVTAATAAQAQAKLSELAMAVCAPLSPAVRTVWLPRLERLIPSLVEEFQALAEREERVVALEQAGRADLNGITLHARADRIDQGRQGVWLVDYKTGLPPTAREVALGQKPQLAVEAWLQQRQAYVSKAALAGVSVWHVPVGSTKPLAVKRYDDAALSKVVPTWQEVLQQGLECLIAFYQQVENGYTAVPGAGCLYCPYAGVCRKAEWATEGEG